MADGAAGAGEMPGESAPSARKQSRKHSVEDLTRQPIKRSGWLQKKGGQSRRNWKRRYFVLRGNKLQYFKKKVDPDAMVLPKPKGAIPIFGIVAEEYDQHHSRPWILSLAKADEERRSAQVGLHEHIIALTDHVSAMDRNANVESATIRAEVAKQAASLDVERGRVVFATAGHLHRFFFLDLLN